jgi:hypothetical protein
LNPERETPVFYCTVHIPNFITKTRIKYKYGHIAFLGIRKRHRFKFKPQIPMDTYRYKTKQCGERTTTQQHLKAYVLLSGMTSCDYATATTQKRKCSLRRNEHEIRKKSDMKEFTCTFDDKNFSL